MSDILERLKENGPWDGLPRGEAIAEIERLRARIAELESDVEEAQPYLQSRRDFAEMRARRLL